MTVRRIVPNITVGDIDRALRTYVDVLGMEVVMNHGWIVTLADTGDIERQVSLLTVDATASVNPCVSVEVDDIDVAYASAIASGATIVHELTDEEWGVRRFFFQDLDGNVINVLAHG